jgi:hypothetical protein
MRLSFIVGTLAASFVAGCSSGSPSASSSPTPSSAPAASASAAASRTYRANITSTGATSSRISGTITLTPIDASTYSVAMEIRGAPTNRQLPWAIRPGSCGDVTPNSDIGSRSAYSPIQTRADGQANINTRLRIELPAQSLHVDIMQSQQQRDIIVGCGVLLAR